MLPPHRCTMWDSITFFAAKTTEPPAIRFFFRDMHLPESMRGRFWKGASPKPRWITSAARRFPGTGLSSYPHPRLMPDFWEFPTVSMGLGPLTAIYQARFNRYLQARGIANTENSRVWCFLGDGECDEPEALGIAFPGIPRKARQSDFCGELQSAAAGWPVRGNGKIIQELEMVFRGAGWNVIKVIWGREWDDLLRRDQDGVLLEKMNETVDGAYQKYATAKGDYIREHFFGPDPRLRKLVEHLSDRDLQNLRRGGHDYRKLYAAYKLAVEHKGSPTVILAKTVKGWALGEGFLGKNVTHQLKKMNLDQLREFRSLSGVAHHRPAAGRGALLSSRDRTVRRFSICLSGAVRSGGFVAAAHRPQQAAPVACVRSVRRIQTRDRDRAGSFDHDGLCPAVAVADARQGNRPAHRADHPG